MAWISAFKWRRKNYQGAQRVLAREPVAPDSIERSAGPLGPGIAATTSAQRDRSGDANERGWLLSELIMSINFKYVS